MNFIPLINQLNFLPFFFQVDVDECEELSLRYDITSMPTFVFLKNGQQIEKFSGANKEKLTSLIQNLAA